MMFSNNYCQLCQNGHEIKQIKDPTRVLDLAGAETSRFATRDVKLVLRASLERKALGKASVGWIVVIPWTCFRAAFFRSSKSMMQQLCGRPMLEQDVVCLFKSYRIN